MRDEIIVVPYVCCLGPPRIKPLQPQLHAELGGQLQISCTATNAKDASVKLNFTWRVSNSAQYNITRTDEDDSHMATSTLHIGKVTHHHSGVYQCIVDNGGSASVKTSSEVVVQGTD